MPRISLRARLLASFILILLPILALLIYDYVDENERRTETILNGQMQTAQAVAALVVTYFEEALTLGSALANDPVVSTFDPSQLDPHLARLASYNRQYESLGVVNADGDLVGTSSSQFPAGASRARVVTDRPYFQELMATAEPVISEVLITRVTPLVRLVMGVPILDDSGKAIGAVLLSPSPEAFLARLEAVSLSPAQHIFVVDKTGTVAFHTAVPDIPFEQRNVRRLEPIRASLEGRPTEVRHYVSPFVGGDRLGAFTPTPKYGWVVGVTVPEDVALAPVRASLIGSLIVFIAVVTLSVAMAFVLSHIFLQPIRRLIDHALVLARGQLDRRVRVKTGDELEELARTLNYMAEQLETRDAENERLSQLKDEFLTVAAHELKTPVTGIRGYAQLLLRWEHEGVSPRGRKALEAISRQTDRITRLVNELLDVSRIRAGRLELRLTSFDLSELAAEVIERMKLATEKHRFLFQSAGPLIVNADRDRIEQVLNNLLDNAVKFSPSGGDIETAVRPSQGRIGGEAIVSVRDHGIGIPIGERGTIFEPFYRAPSGLPYGGVGMGLHLSREIVIRHGGRIWFDSEEGKGSTFYFSLPLEGPLAEDGGLSVER